jgi:hypothetical protein
MYAEVERSLEGICLVTRVDIDRRQHDCHTPAQLLGIRRRC